MIDTVMPQIDLLILVLEDRVMGLRMIALLGVDRCRNWLLDSLARSMVQEGKIVEEALPNYTHANFYKDENARVVTMVDQKVLATLAVFACIMTRNGYNLNDLYSPIAMVDVGHSKDEILFRGSLSLEDILEAADCAEVDHVVDFLLTDDVSLHRYGN